MNLKFAINKAFSLPPHAFIKKVAFVVARKFKHIAKQKRDCFFSSYSNKAKSVVPLNLNKIESLNINGLNNIAESYMQHRFDLLGSGWCENSYDSLAFGLMGNKYNNNVNFDIDTLIKKPNLNKSTRIYNFVDNSYNPIDWQKDFKSGFRWNEKKWYRNQRNSLPGVDIKVPWELGRLQHLPQLALFAINNEGVRDRVLREFRNQVLDFIAMNPPRFGVQWTCTMDVGIRVANMLIAYDLFIQDDLSGLLDDEFKNIFAGSIYDHGLHIVNNLEYGENLTSNHYLSDIAGLLFVAVHLPSCPQINQWLAFSIQEIISEMRKQFNEDGSNFEASTSYHRLSSEIMVYVSALILGLSNEKIESLQQYSIKNWKFQPKLNPSEKQEYKIVDNHIVLPDWFIKRLFNAGRFTKDITKPTGEIPQIGDNDSGRFVRLSPNGELITSDKAKEKYKNLNDYKTEDNDYCDENILNHQTLLAAMNGLFEEEIFNTDFKTEKQIVEMLGQNRKLKTANIYKKTLCDSTDIFDDLKYKTRKVFDVPEHKKNITHNLKFIAYPDTGIYILKSEKIYLLVSAGPNGQKGNGGHAHNDKLSFELNIDGKDIVVDPGTFLYTPQPEERNRFRSTASHNTIIVKGEEQNQWMQGRNGLFFMKNQSKCYLLDYNENLIHVAVEFRGIKNRRKFIIKDSEVIIESFSNREFSENFNKFELYSNGYGKVISNG